MNLLNFCWLMAFTVLLAALNVLYSMLTRYISDKPLGNQSLYDVIFRDTVNIVQLYGTTYCLLAIFSRFESISNVLSENIFLGNVACLFYAFTFTATCVNLACMCVTRTFCLVNISFMEECLGETLIRVGTGL
jgi:hypothetical protein